MSGLIIREAIEADRAAIGALVERAFGQASEAELVAALVRDGDAVLELVAEEGGQLAGHVLFSRLEVDRDGDRFAAVALAPVAVEPASQKRGIGSALIEEGHRLLNARGESLSVVLGDPAYYGRFGYAHSRAAGFDSVFQCAALQALDWGAAPAEGRLVYAPAFGV